MKKIVAGILVLMLVKANGLAQDNTLRVNPKEGTQRARTQQSIASGKLTDKDASALIAQQRHIRITEQNAKANGTITPAEKRKLKREQNRAARNIRRQKLNTQLVLLPIFPFPIEY